MGGDQHTVAALGHIYGAMGRRAEAEKILHDLELRSKGQHVSPYLIATIYAGLGDKDRAFAFLEEAYLAKSWDVVENIKSDLRVDNLRSDQRFQVLSQRFAFPR